jgi:hypothetical protein
MLFWLDQAAEIIHPHDGPKVFAVMNMSSYLDESGIHDRAEACVISGYFGKVNHWRPLGKKWNLVLKKHKFPMEKFHAKDLVGRPKHEAMLMDLAEAISDCRIYPVTSGIVVKDFFPFSYNQRKYLTGAEFCGPPKLLKDGGNPRRPYFVPFQLILQRVTDHTAPTAKAHFTFGIDRTFYEYATYMFRKIKLAEPRPTEWQTKRRLGEAFSAVAKQTAELQAADLYSLLSYHHMLERIKPGGEHKQPEPLLAICLSNSKMREDHTYQTRDTIRATIPDAIFNALA